ncbi:MAG: UDP-N-acetylglucosamine-1-phosphate transferase [Methanolobus sp.]|uniref:MraY family glycosyltransferase n=1 Tax=Methanolobus sp. TaxID=1874737 RepID=UPI002730C418|nr:glycosyltransferase 4 family protein [Methanolobus sp.]MDP2216036.1 UDP-N-acetylglucosamine-1-phosphate transferase [Methanolobus sp.]
MTEKGILAKDYYKLKLTMVPDRGGIAILLVAMVCFSLNTLFFKFSTTNYVALIVVALFGLFGMLDDMIDIGRVTKLLLMYYCSYPLIQYATTTAFVFPSIGNFETGILYLQFVVPTFVLVASNLVNMHSGFNGLASGLSTIVLISLIIRSALIGDVENIFAMVCIAGATLGFFLYDRYPSRIFWGNVGSLTIGAAIGALIVIQGFVISGFIMLIPHTVNFLLYVYWRAMKFPVAKFGKTREDGTLEVPNPLTLKWVLPYYYRVTEKQATYAMYAVTGLFCLLGILLPGRM